MNSPHKPASNASRAPAGPQIRYLQAIAIGAGVSEKVRLNGHAERIYARACQDEAVNNLADQI